MLVCVTDIAAADFFIHDGDRVAFLGNGIAEQGLYAAYVESYALTRHPDWRLSFRNLGWRNDTAWLQKHCEIDVNELYKANEADQQRIVVNAIKQGLARNVLPLKPTAMIVDMGGLESYAWRSDLAYPPFVRAEAALVEQLKGNGMRVALLTPPAIEGDDRTPQLDEGNKVIMKFSNGIQEIAKTSDVLFVDQFAPYLSLCIAARATSQKTHIYNCGEGDTGDKANPGPTGQMILAWNLLKSMDAAALVSRAEISSTTRSVVASESCRIEHLSIANGVINFDRSDAALPMPIHPQAMGALAFAPIVNDLDRYELQVTGLASGMYELTIDGKFAAKTTAEELAKGWNLTTCAGPITKQAQDLLTLVFRKNELFFTRWRKVQLFKFPDWTPATEGEAVRTAELERLDRAIAETEAQITTLRKPIPHHIELKALSP